MVPARAGIGAGADDHAGLPLGCADRADPGRRVRGAGADRRLFAAFARFDRATFLAYGLALLPFFVFDYWFYAVEPMLTWIGLLDLVGNVVMLGFCVLGWRIAGRKAAG